MAWGDETEWQTVWQTDFSSAPTGMTYSVTNGSVDISTGVLDYNQGGKSGDRAINTAFTDDVFKVETDWKLEFDWGGQQVQTKMLPMFLSPRIMVLFSQLAGQNMLLPLP